MEAHRAPGIGVFSDEDLAADLDAHSQLFKQLPRQARFMRFVWFAFSAREFPQALEVRPAKAARQQEGVVAFDHGCEDDHSAVAPAGCIGSHMSTLFFVRL